MNEQHDTSTASELARESLRREVIDIYERLDGPGKWACYALIIATRDKQDIVAAMEPFIGREDAEAVAAAGRRAS